LTSSAVPFLPVALSATTSVARFVAAIRCFVSTDLAQNAA
jgi:hypothetical protein